MRKKAMFFKHLEGEAVRCYLCAQHCKIDPGELGFCGVRFNDAGTLMSLVYGETIAQNVDPIEKKPLYHFLPGSWSFSIATIGCNFHCGFCQNWQISQVREQRRNPFSGDNAPPSEVVAKAQKSNCRSISYTYTEPTIFFEYAYDTAKLAKEAGIANVFVTNGFMGPEALDEIKPYLDAANVDLKAWSTDYYQDHCEARLKPVLKTIEKMKELGVWVEATTLVVPGENDSDEQLQGIAGFLAEVGKEIPWHISRFHPQYRFDHVGPTPLETLSKAKRIGEEAGLHYVYLGNVGEPAVTSCPKCGRAVLNRGGFRTEKVNLKDGKCTACGATVHGVWD